MIAQAYRELFENSNASAAYSHCPERTHLAPTILLSYDESSMMRRAQAVFVIVALLATPLALLARGEVSACTSMCCLPHGHHAAQHKTMECQHGELGHVFECTMNSGHHTDYGLIAPIVPAVPSAIAFIAMPDASRDFLAQFREISAAGFLSAPLRPPRT